VGDKRTKFIRRPREHRLRLLGRRER
jgi:hypothetical protein